MESFATVDDHVYIVTKRGRPLSDKSFCSLECLDAHLAEAHPEWETWGESLVFEPGARCVHTIMISEVKNVEEHIRHKNRPGI